jgi:NADH-quinone oxidoreductase subunit L
MGHWLLFIPLLPLLAAAVILFFGEAFLKRHSHWPCVLSIGGACVLSFMVLAYVRGASLPDYPPLNKLLETVRETPADKIAEQNKPVYRMLRKLGYKDLYEQAVTGASEPAEKRKADLDAILVKAQERHKAEAGHPSRILYARFTWIAASYEPEPSEDDEHDEIRASRGPVSPARVSFGLRADPLSAIMLVMITSIATCIAIYSVGYMDRDPGYPRFFAAVSLFVFSMCMLVLGDNFLLLFLGWEGVGLCSYLLIGFWYSKPSAADAARKAFLVTRIGDVGLFLGILMLWLQFGTLEYDGVFGGWVEAVKAGKLSNSFMVSAALLLFCGAVGKSAQFPLHVWLPDAMEGPTPVSALIHAATMVTAGVYLVARCTPIYMAVPEAQLVIACIGGTTMLLAALIALTQNDLKRVLAYSTLSQLGYMFLALGCALKRPAAAFDATHGLVTFAVTAAMFHLFTHAFFKALLFLSAGSVMTAMHHVIDMRHFSGLRKVLPYTHWAFLAGAVSLSALPLTSGFFSKDEILVAAYEASHVSHGASSTIYLVLLSAAILTAFLTAFYTFRAYFKTFWGELKLPAEVTGHGHGHGHAKAKASHGHGHDHDHAASEPAHHGDGKAHESPPVMTIPLLILAIPALIIGALLGPLTHFFGRMMEKVPYFPSVPEGGEHHNWTLMILGTAAGLLGVALAWLLYVRQPQLPAEMAKRYPLLYQVSLNKFFFDEIYLALIVRPAESLAAFCRSIDMNVVDAFVDLVGQVPRLIGALFRPVQNGLVQFYALAMILGLTVFLLALVRSL